MLSCGIGSLPDVGRSAFFNAITKTELVQAANFPFCTIEPNIAQVDVIDYCLKIAACTKRLDFMFDRIFK